MKTVMINNGTCLNENHFEDFENSLRVSTLTHDGTVFILQELERVLGPSEWQHTSDGDLIEIEDGTYWSIQNIDCDDDGYLNSVDIDC